MKIVRKQTKNSNQNKKKILKKDGVKSKPKTNKNHPKYGTSKLEDDFAHDFLDKLNIKYSRQYEAKDIGRFYDFYLDNSRLLIEIDGDYYHSNPNTYDEDKLSPMQKKNRRVDKLKDEWALMHGIPIIRFWESDIRKNPDKVLKELKERLYIQDDKIEKKNNKNKRHKNKLLK